MLGLKLKYLFFKCLLLDQSLALVFTHLRITQESSLLLHLVYTIGTIKCFVTVGPKFCQLDLDLVKLLVQIVERPLSLLVLLTDVLELLAGVGHNNDGDSDFPRQLAEFFIALFDLFIQRLVLNLKLLKIDQMQTISQLLLLFKNFLAISQLISQLNILKSILMHFRVLSLISRFPVIDHSVTKRLVRP